MYGQKKWETNTIVIMRKKVFITVLMLAGSLLIQAQEQMDNYLQDVVKAVKELRKNNNSVRNSAITTLSANGKPKITLMDEIKLVGNDHEKANEIKGAKGNFFKLNQVIAYIYKKQNHQLESKSNMLNGNEVGINYSAIEKSVKRGGMVTYQIKGRMGRQEFVFVPYHSNTKYQVTISVDGGEDISRVATDVCQIPLKRVYRNQAIYISIGYLDDKSNKDDVESFAILNYNPQK